MFIRVLIAKFLTIYIISSLLGQVVFQLHNNAVYSLGIATGSILVDLAVKLIKKSRNKNINNTQI